MLCLLQCILLRVYSICVALMAMLSRVYFGSLTHLWHVLIFTLLSLELNLPSAPHLMAIPRLRSKNGAVLTL